MKEFSPKEINKLNESRKKEEQWLILEGAEKREKGRLNITYNQYANAHLDMTKELLTRPIVKFEGTSEIQESRIFTPEEVGNVIAEIEEVAPKDIILVQRKEDEDGNIIWMDFKLKDGIAYGKYHRPVAYVFQLKGVFSPKEIEAGYQDVPAINPVTEISRDFLFTDEEQEKFRKGKVDVEEPGREIITRYVHGKWVIFGPLLGEE